MTHYTYQSKAFFRTPLILIALLGLAACDSLDDLTSSDGGQSFAKFTPGVKPTPKPTPTPIVVADNDGTEPAEETTAPSPAPQSTPEPTSEPAPTPEPVSEPAPEPESAISNTSISGTGIVWKPVSEGDHKLVVLTPSSYGKPSVTILDKAGRAVESGRYVGHTNGNRATYRFSRAGGGYSSPAYLRVNSSIYRVERTSSRYN